MPRISVVLSALAAIFLLAGNAPAQMGHWESVIDPLRPAAINSIAFASGGNMYLATSDHGVLRSLDGGKSWQMANVGLSATVNVALIAAGPGVLYLATNGGLIYRSLDGGDYWSAVDHFESQPTAFGFDRKGVTYVATKGSGIFQQDASTQSWTSVPASDQIGYVSGIAVSLDGRLLAGADDGVYVFSQDLSSVTHPLAFQSGSRPSLARAFDGSIVIVSDTQKVYNFTTFPQVILPSDSNAGARSVSADSSGQVYIRDGSLLTRLTEASDTWIPHKGTLPDFQHFEIDFAGDIFATFDNSCQFSYDTAKSWVQRPWLDASIIVPQIATSVAHTLYLPFGTSLYCCTDGINWTWEPTGIRGKDEGETGFFALGADERIFRWNALHAESSNDNGLHWTAVADTLRYRIAGIGSGVAHGKPGPLFALATNVIDSDEFLQSDDSGRTWRTLSSIQMHAAERIFFIDSIGFVLNADSGKYTMDLGKHWTTIKGTDTKSFRFTTRDLLDPTTRILFWQAGAYYSLRVGDSLDRADSICTVPSLDVASDGSLYALLPINNALKTALMHSSGGIHWDTIARTRQYVTAQRLSVGPADNIYSVSWPWSTSSQNGIMRYEAGPDAVERTSKMPLQLSLYPNPANYELRIERHDAGTARLDLLDAAGRLVLSQSLNRAQLIVTLDVSAIASGQYSLTIKSEGGLESAEVAIEH